MRQTTGGRFIVEEKARLGDVEYVNVGALVEIENAGVAIVEDLNATLSAQHQICKIRCRTLNPEVTTGHNLLGREVRLATADELRQYFARNGNDGLELGEIADRADQIPLQIRRSPFISSHSCFFGGSGSGKSTLLKLLLEHVLLEAPDGLQVVVLDPNSDFKGFLDPAPEPEVNAAWNSCSKLDSKLINARQTVLSKVRSSFHSDPRLCLQRMSAYSLAGLAGRALTPASELRLLHYWEELRRQNLPINPCAILQTQRSETAHLGANLRDEELELLAAVKRLEQWPIWSLSDEDSLSVLDSTPRPQLIQYDLARLEANTRAQFSICVLSHLWNRASDGKGPRTLVVIDEAHNLVPALPDSQTASEAASLVNRIAGEGRKYGLFLVVVSQRPAKIHANTLDNCRNFFICRLQNREDLVALGQRASILSEALLERVSLAPPHLSLVYGDVSAPMFGKTGRRTIGH